MIIKSLNSCSLIWLTLLFTVVLKFTISLNTGLFEDEAIYWSWSQTPDPSYSFTTLLSLKLLSSLFGNESELFVRLPALISNFVLLFFFFRIGKLLGADELKILYTSLLFFSVPFVTIYTSFISPDSMLLLFSVASIYFAMKIIKLNKTADWILCGLSLGLMLLSKYTGIIYFLIFVFYLLINRNIFSEGFAKKLLLLILTYLITVSPLLYWNLFNEPVWLNHYLFTDADMISSGYFDLLKVFFFSQIAIMLPFIFILIVLIIKNIFSVKNKSGQEKFLLFLFSAMLIVFIIIALSGKIKGNWFFIMYIPLLISVMVMTISKYFKILLAMSVTVNILILVILNLPVSGINSITDNFLGKYISGTFQNYWPGHTGNAHNDNSWKERLVKMKNWKNTISVISEEIGRTKAEYDFFATNDFNLVSLLEYYFHTGEKIYLLGDLRFKYINSAEPNLKLAGKNAILISYDERDFNNFESKFEKVILLKKIDRDPSKDFTKDFILSYGENFNPSDPMQK
ncbi:MAG: glycosyltransferase family 39 protein [Ignavibacteria bacterium]